MPYSYSTSFYFRSSLSHKIPREHLAFKIHCWRALSSRLKASLGSEGFSILIPSKVTIKNVKNLMLRTGETEHMYCNEKSSMPSKTKVLFHGDAPGFFKDAKCVEDSH